MFLLRHFVFGSLVKRAGSTSLSGLSGISAAEKLKAFQGVNNEPALWKGQIIGG